MTYSNSYGRSRAVVVGAGMGGLASAIALAARGADVTVVDAAPHAGGKAGFGEVDGVRFDTGPSLLTMPNVVESVFRIAGEDVRDHLTWIRHDRPFRYQWRDGQVFDVFHDRERTIASAHDTFGSRAGRDLRRFLDYAQRIWEAAAPSFVFGPSPSISTLLGTDLKTLLGLRSIDALSSMQQSIHKRVENQRLRAVLMRYATYNGSDVRQAPGTLNCIAHVELGLGGFGVEGGMYALVEALTALAERCGVRFAFESPVSRIDCRGRTASAVRLASGERLDAELIVSNVDVVHLARLLDRTPPDHTFSMSGWTAVFRAAEARGPGGERCAHTVVMPEGYEREFSDIFDGRQVPASPAVYACDQALAHHRPGWSDDTVPLFAMVNSPVASAVGDTDFEALESRVRDTLVAAGVLQPGAEAVWRRTPAQLAVAFPGSDGSIYGPASNSPLSAFRRMSNRHPDVRGLYIASGSAHPGGGVPLCLLSGLAAARAVTDDGGVSVARRSA